MFANELQFALQTDDKRVRAWREEGTRNRPLNLTERYAFPRWKHYGVGRDRADLHIFRWGSVMAVRFWNEVLHSTVRWHGTLQKLVSF
ncbi:hypothetical protein CDAR_457881 [Caerostris darwini]|uniref:Uncharacterized protein n=1 Tax=Caerostris darwini TaxID=1538125 RepID=A0AAV4VA00_9ARAC|nr:hypothetical protein CDAR_457881 [Caerostris darwini]